jgi:transcriptional regulator with XRE-family HTH domain
MPAPLAEIITARRKDLGLTQSDVAKRASVSRPTIIALEQGRSLRMDVLQQILGALGMALSAEIVQGKLSNFGVATG